jgi:hypothetical protein
MERDVRLCSSGVRSFSCKFFWVPVEFVFENLSFTYCAVYAVWANGLLEVLARPSRFFQGLSVLVADPGCPAASFSH